MPQFPERVIIADDRMREGLRIRRAVIPVDAKRAASARRVAR